MKPVYTVFCNEDPLHLVAYGGMKRYHKQGHRIVWNFNGMLGVIPPAVLESAFATLADYRKRRRTFDMMPSAVSEIRWEQVVRLSEVESHDPGRDRTDT